MNHSEMHRSIFLKHHLLYFPDSCQTARLDDLAYLRGYSEKTIAFASRQQLYKEKEKTGKNECSINVISKHYCTLARDFNNNIGSSGCQIIRVI
jgi:hypothetical protein